MAEISARIMKISELFESALAEKEGTKKKQCDLENRILGQERKIAFLRRQLNKNNIIIYNVEEEEEEEAENIVETVEKVIKR